MKIKIKKKILWILSFIFFVYVSSYLFLSIQGSYVPAAWGLGSVKFYGWSPKYFTCGPMQTEWRKPILYTFLPLYIVDVRLWHTYDRAIDGKYPINTVLDDELHKSHQ
jgi:hypothetical protein